MDREKISNIIRIVDTIIDMSKTKDDNLPDLTDDEVEQYIQRAIVVTKCQLDSEEYDQLKRDITYKYQIKTNPGESILANYDLNNWYDGRKAEIAANSVFWTRYKNYLIDKKHFSPNVVTTLEKETLDQKLMNYILDPDAKYDVPVMKRGLVIGDVQSGKTSTYIGFLCKAADAGYKVFILLTGTVESLRKQTQERIEEGFTGIDMSSESKDGKRVGVGEDNQPIKAISITSRTKDFVGASDQTAISLDGIKNPIVFVIKKNTTTLKKLTRWLVGLNKDNVTKKINMPMLMIDDEADNASINTSSNREDPSKINKQIRELANEFSISNYVGFTATPFANVFIDPETTEEMETQDLFPEDFIVTLPTPSNYIGPNQIFATDGEYHDQIIYINDAGREKEDGHSFYFKHEKEWAGKLPSSLTDAIYAFYIVNAIRDLRGDSSEHRSMLINISRFVQVQKHIKEEVEEIHKKAYRAIKFNLSTDNQSLKDPILSHIFKIWNEYYSNIEPSWSKVAAVLFRSMENIQIKVVNSLKSSEKLEYPKGDSTRVIAIGGLALSRGLTLEGLVISYFYRNTSTYDVLMQMGRWFGYRNNYADLCRIWIHMESAGWYQDIADATNKLKEDMGRMRELGKKPKDFGIRVRNNSADLRITAYNKMRNSTDEFEYESYYGSIVETPYLPFDAKAHINNYNAVINLVNDLLKNDIKFERQKSKVGKGRYILQDIPKNKIIEFVEKIKISKDSLRFDTRQIISFLQESSDPSIDKFDIAFMDGDESNNAKSVEIAGRKIYLVQRKTCIIDRDKDRLQLGRRGKLGGPSDGLAGIIDFNGKSAEEIVQNAKETFEKNYEETQQEKFTRETNYPSNTWFKYIKDRKPLMIVYLIDVGGEDDTQKKQFDELREGLGDAVVVGFALGIPKSDNNTYENANTTRYKVNKKYNPYMVDDEIDISEEE